VSTARRAQETLEAEGHLIDSQLLARIFDKIVERGGSYEVEEFRIGRTNDEPSRARLVVSAPDERVLGDLVAQLVPLGCRMVSERDARLEGCPKHGCAPLDFYSTTNHRTHVRLAGRWVEVERQRMDAAIVVADGRAACRKLRDLRAGDRVVVGHDGVRVLPEPTSRDRHGFAFMANDISSERRIEVAVARVAEMMREERARGGRVVFVAGPVVVHTGASEAFIELVRRGWVDALLSGNALAVHDVEVQFHGTSLGVSARTGAPVEEGHKHHMRAINSIRHAGSLRAAVESGMLKGGVMHACIAHGVPFVLAGSIRDDGPLPDTLMDLVEAQDAYARELEGAGVVVMLSSMLHAIGVGNMLPSWTKVVCIDINPAVVTKLSDRGSAQTVGVVTDVGLFLQQLVRELPADGEADED
jgi:lysine-ketoglutarate reductase/saccharopine dehydrogenase-like protein (TIGR00300 family)